jgi:hypothetical protein
MCIPLASRSAPQIFAIKLFFAKKCLLAQKSIFCHHLTQELCTFLEPAESFFLTLIRNGGTFLGDRRSLIRGGGTFLEDNRSNQVETDQHFKKCFFYKLG